MKTLISERLAFRSKVGAHAGDKIKNWLLGFVLFAAAGLVGWHSHLQPDVLLSVVEEAVMEDSASFANLLRMEIRRVGAEQFTAPSYKPGAVEHIVLLKFKVTVSKSKQEEVMREFMQLGQRCVRHGKPYIRAMTMGAQASGEMLSHGFDQAVVMVFDSEGDRNYYVGRPIVNDPAHFDPAHDAFKKYLAPFLMEGQSGVLVFDFKVNDVRERTRAETHNLTGNVEGESGRSRVKLSDAART
ncbi:Dabb family protein [Burkholderia vietnamiensis]|uniref:Dabb family protein n=1 Tax=Burkholderia vietnamiensis TaxID=60552 RepID=UPI000B1EFBF7|nr:Dabb family protein [Burkholderia vietnamiensis]